MIVIKLAPDNYWAKFLRGILLLDINFKEREGLKLIQEVNSEVPYKAIPMMCLAIAFAYSQEPEKALLTLKDCLQRFKEHSHMCYVFMAYLRVQEILLKASEEKPIEPQLMKGELELKEPDESELQKRPLFSESMVHEIELLFKKAISRLLSGFNLEYNDHEVSRSPSKKTPHSSVSFPITTYRQNSL